MNDPNPIAIAKSLGLTLPSPAYVFFAIVFGLVGIAVFRLGRKRERPTVVVLALVLMVYPYLVGSTTWLVVIGVALCAAVWWDLRR